MKSIVVALFGHPNSGKTTLFNALTDSKQKVGNWAGVTVDKKKACCQGKIPFEVVDLPGCYAVPDPRLNASGIRTLGLNTLGLDTLGWDNTVGLDTSAGKQGVIVEEAALDEKITHNFLASHEADVLVNVVNATELEHQLYLSLQLIAWQSLRGKPIIVALNMMDEVDKQGIQIDCQQLSQQLGCTVLPIVALKKNSLTQLKDAILREGCAKTSENQTVLGSTVLDPKGLDPRGLDPKGLGPMLQDLDLPYDDLQAATERFELIHKIVAKVCKREKVRDPKRLTRSLDNLVLHRYFALPLFLAMMYLMFVFTIVVGGGIQKIWEGVLQIFFLDWMVQGLNGLGTSDWLQGLLIQGFGQGMMTTLTFIPVVALLFLCLSFLEGSGYMARATFIMDKLMQAVGLSGKAFVPMILGFGCNVPAILATRTLESRSERILTILMSPFMSCSARLAVYALFVTAFFQVGGYNIIFILYLIGILFALATGFSLGSILCKYKNCSLIMELPPYRLPSVGRLLKSTVFRVKNFVMKAGVIIVPLCIILSSLTAFKASDGEPWINHLGKAMTPIFKPMGIEKENWPATVGLITGIFAKEVMVGTLNALYAIEAKQAEQTKHVEQTGQMKEAEQAEGMKQGEQAGRVKRGEHTEQTEQTGQVKRGNQVNQTSYKNEDSVFPTSQNIMINRFGTQISAFSYLLFVLLYFPCVSVLATISRELSLGWAIFSVVWTTSIAYAVAVLFYQAATFREHPQSALIWIISMCLLIFMGLKIMKKWVIHNIQKDNSKRPPLPTQLLIIN